MMIRESLFVEYLKKMSNTRVGAAVCDRLFVLVDAIKKPRKKKQQK